MVHYRLSSLGIMSPNLGQMLLWKLQRDVMPSLYLVHLWWPCPPSGLSSENLLLSHFNQKKIWSTWLLLTCLLIRFLSKCIIDELVLYQHRIFFTRIAIAWPEISFLRVVPSDSLTLSPKIVPDGSGNVTLLLSLHIPVRLSHHNFLVSFFLLVFISFSPFWITYINNMRINPCNRAAREAGAATAIINIGATRADDIVPLKISARVGEVSALYGTPEVLVSVIVILAFYFYSFSCCNVPGTLTYTIIWCRYFQDCSMLDH